MPDEDLESARTEGGAMLSELSDEMVRAQKRYFGKGPTSAKSYMFDDLLLIVMRGGQTTAEKTMLHFDQEDKVRDFRQTFENEMTERLTDMVEGVTGRKVLGYQSQIIFEPDVVVELFILDDTGTANARKATGLAQLEDEPIGEASDHDALDAPTDGGQ